MSFYICRAAYLSVPLILSHIRSHARTHVRLHMQVCVLIHVHTYILHTHTHICTYTYIHTRMHMHIFNTYIHIRMNMHTYLTYIPLQTQYTCTYTRHARAGLISSSVSRALIPRVGNEKFGVGRPFPAAPRPISRHGSGRRGVRRLQ